MGTRRASCEISAKGLGLRAERGTSAGKRRPALSPLPSALVLQRALRTLLFVSLMGVCALAQSPGYGVGRTPTPEEIRAWDISIGPTGEELPPGHGTAKEGALVYRAK